MSDRIAEPIGEPITVSMKTEGMAAFMVEPRRDSAVVKLGDEIIHINLYAQQLVVASDADMVRATNDLTLISKLSKAIEEKRRGYLDPLREHTKAINDFFKLLVSPLDIADKTVREKMMAYHQAIEARRREEERINSLRLEAAQAEMKLKGELTEPVNLVEVSPVAPRKVITDLGSVGTTRLPKWELVDFAAVPDDLKMLDAVKIGKLVRAGIGSISGIRIWIEESLRVTAR